MKNLGQIYYTAAVQKRVALALIWYGEGTTNSIIRTEGQILFPIPSSYTLKYLKSVWLYFGNRVKTS
jgi:hypothetical protein